MTDALEPIPSRPAGLTETVYARIREAIVTSRIAPGEQVTEAKLAERLGVSKTPVREALVRLAHVGFVEPEGRRGLRVPVPSAESIRSAYEVRAALETQTARLAAQRRTDDEAAEITRLAEASRASAEAADLAGFRAHDQRLHAAIAAASGNRPLAHLVTDYLDLVTTLRRRDAPEVDNSSECAAQHVRIAAAIAAHAPDDAERHMRAHLAKVQAMVEAGLGARGEEETPTPSGA
ncbi:GntR family transcriptional regulator [Nocardiopsis sp. NPDC050513]|uniref:GntR family transcriptional regulator n=1 Tax=Nocardiopsis sp. NPDC050513 TaxID=3364338 RepID=UPI0037A61886